MFETGHTKYEYIMTLGRCSNRCKITLCNKCVMLKKIGKTSNKTQMKEKTQPRSFSRIRTNNDGHGGRTTLE